MTLNPRIRQASTGVWYLDWDPDPQAIAYDIITSTGQHVQAGKAKTTAKLTSKLGAPKPNPLPQIAAAHAGTYETAVDPTAPPPDGAFMSYPLIPPKDYSGDTNIEISNASLRGIHQNHVLHFENCHNVWVHDVDFDDCGGDSEAVIYFLSCTGTVRVEDCRFRQPGYHSVQLNQCTANGFVRNIKVKGAARSEDMISLYQSGGVSPITPFVVEDNQLEGGDWQSGSGSGIMVGDSGGQHITVRRNRLLNPGQVGIGVAGGSDIAVEDNTVYGKQMPRSNVGIYAWHQSGPPSDDVRVTGNKVNWRNAAGNSNPWWNGGNITNLVNQGNDWGADIDPASLAVTL